MGHIFGTSACVDTSTGRYNSRKKRIAIRISIAIVEGVVVIHFPACASALPSGIGAALLAMAIRCPGKEIPEAAPVLPTEIFMPKPCRLFHSVLLL